MYDTRRTEGVMADRRVEGVADERSREAGARVRAHPVE